MATGRTVFKHSRVYINGREYNSVAQSFGPLLTEFEEIDATLPMYDGVKSYLPGQATINMGNINIVNFEGWAFMDVYAAFGTQHIYSIPIGIRAAPAAGDPVFHYVSRRSAMSYADNGGLVTYTINPGQWDATALKSYPRAWGVLLHANSAATGANTAAGIDDYGGSTTYGGYMVYQVTNGAPAGGTAAIKIQDAAVNNDGGFADLSGATSGVIDVGTTYVAGYVALANNATVRQYLRWQVALGTATSVTFVLSFVRATSALGV